MSSEKVARMVIGLKKKTEKGEIEWIPSGDDGIYSAEFKNYNLRIYARENYEGSEDICISIYSKDGDFIETFNDTEIDPSEFSSMIAGESFSGSPFRVMSSLLGQARRKALGIDEALDDIISDLEDDF